MLRTFASEMQATLLRVALYGCVLAVFGLIGMELVSSQSGPVVAKPVVASDWIDVVKPIPAFAISIPEFASEPQYAIRRHAGGGGRKDIFTFGNPDAPEATAAIEIYRPGSEAGQPGAAERTASVPELRLSGPQAERTIDTKFGPASIEAFTDRAAQGERRCLRVTRQFDEPAFAINGRFCSAGLELVDRRMVACALDRLTLLSAGSDPRLGALFARAELKRSFCGQNSVFVAATPKRTDWIEASRDPKLRGRQ